MIGIPPLFQLWATLAAVGLFGVAVYLTRATPLRIVGAFVATILFTGFNVLWDLLAHAAGWWWYPWQASRLVPLPVYFAQDLVWGGTFSLVGWRIQRRFGSLSLVVFLFLLSILGSIRDAVFSSLTKTIVFGPSPTSRLADFACWATLLASAQLTMRLVAGPVTGERLSRTRPSARI